MVSLRRIFVVAIFAAVFGFALFEKRVAIGLSNEVEAGRQHLQRLTLAAHQAQLATRETDQQPGRRSSLSGNSSTRPLVAGSDAAFEAEITSWLRRVNGMRRSLAEHPELNIPELQLLTEKEWFAAGHKAALQARFTQSDGHPPVDPPDALAVVREVARGSFLSLVAEAVAKFREQNQQAMPSNFEELKPFLPATIESTMLARYDATLLGNHFVCSEKVAGSVDPDHLAVFDLDTGPGPQDSFITFQTALERVVHDASRRYAAAHGGANPAEPEQLLPFLTKPVDSSVLAETFAAQAMSAPTR